MADLAHPQNWMQVDDTGLCCKPAKVHIDPNKPVDCAIITHAHADHARPGHRRVIATPKTLDIMRTRYPDDRPQEVVALEYGDGLMFENGVRLQFAPAGHILGSAQVILDHAGRRLVISGDYKRHPDPTCEPFQAVKCDVFVTEATFALPVFSHPPIEQEIGKLVRSLERFPEHTHVVGVYALGKCQRVMKALREAGYVKPFFLHGALTKLTELYESHNMTFGDWRLAADYQGKERDVFRGHVVLCPPGSLTDQWSRTLCDPIPALASGWMQIRARARQRRVEMPLVISDHADWSDLIRTCIESGAREVWITHGRTDALRHELSSRGIYARALDLVGRDDGVE